MDIKKLRKVVAAQGFTWNVTGGNHIAWKDPHGRTVAISSSTPSDYRTMQNLMADLRKAGVQLPRKDGKLDSHRRTEQS